MKSDEELEQALRKLAQNELETELTPSQVHTAVNKAHEAVAYREGLGFLTALLWVLVAGFGVKMWGQIQRAKGASSLSPVGHKQGDKS